MKALTLRPFLVDLAVMKFLKASGFAFWLAPGAPWLLQMHHSFDAFSNKLVDGFGGAARRQRWVVLGRVVRFSASVIGAMQNF